MSTAQVDSAWQQAGGKGLARHAGRGKDLEVGAQRAEEARVAEEDGGKEDDGGKDGDDEPRLAILAHHVVDQGVTDNGGQDADGHEGRRVVALLCPATIDHHAPRQRRVLDTGKTSVSYPAGANGLLLF